MNKNLNNFLILMCSLLFIWTPICAQESLILISREAGFGSIFMDVTAILNTYDNKIIKGVEINFGKTGLYFDPPMDKGHLQQLGGLLLEQLTPF